MGMMGKVAVVVVSSSLPFYFRMLLKGYSRRSFCCYGRFGDLIDVEIVMNVFIIVMPFSLLVFLSYSY